LVEVAVAVAHTQLVMAAQVAQEHWFLAVEAVAHRNLETLVQVALVATDS
jgi:hypothetical protein